MKTHKLSLDDAFDEEFHLFAIYTDEEDYRIAFILNQHLNIQLKRSDAIIVKKTNAKFSIFEYDDVAMYQNWFLLQNQSLSEKEVINPLDLFSQNPTIFQQKVFFLKELKKARFLLKIIAEDTNNLLKNINEKLKNIPQIYTVELVDLTHLKNKKSLLF